MEEVSTKMVIHPDPWCFLPGGFHNISKGHPNPGGFFHRFYLHHVANSNVLHTSKLCDAPRDCWYLLNMFMMPELICHGSRVIYNDPLTGIPRVQLNWETRQLLSFGDELTLHLSVDNKTQEFTQGMFTISFECSFTMPRPRTDGYTRHAWIDRLWNSIVATFLNCRLHPDRMEGCTSGNAWGLWRGVSPSITQRMLLRLAKIGVRNWKHPEVKVLRRKDIAV